MCSCQLRVIWEQTQEGIWVLPTLHPPRSCCLFLPCSLQSSTQTFPAFFMALRSLISDYTHIFVAFTPSKLSWDVPQQFHLMFRVPQWSSAASIWGQISILGVFLFLLFINSCLFFWPFTSWKQELMRAPWSKWEFKTSFPSICLLGSPIWICSIASPVLPLGIISLFLNYKYTSLLP